MNVFVLTWPEGSGKRTEGLEGEALDGLFVHVYTYTNHSIASEYM